MPTPRTRKPRRKLEVRWSKRDEAWTVRCEAEGIDEFRGTKRAAERLSRTIARAFAEDGLWVELYVYSQDNSRITDRSTYPRHSDPPHRKG